MLNDKVRDRPHPWSTGLELLIRQYVIRRSQTDEEADAYLYDCCWDRPVVVLGRFVGEREVPSASMWKI